MGQSIPYYPGCTLNTVAKDFDTAARASFAQLGLTLEDLSQWNCCGASFPLTPDNLIGLAGPMNVLIQSQKAGGTVSTLCSFCYNTLKRTNKALKDDGEKRTVLNDFLKSDYQAEVQVLHLLEVLRDRLGFDTLNKAVTRPLKGLKVAAYYGCMLLRPPGTGIDHPEAPSIFEEFLKALGCAPVEFPDRGECCGSHLAMSEVEIVKRLSGTVLRSAREWGADVITTSCPLCFHNLEKSQQALLKEDGGSASGGGGLPILYFTQVLGMALGQEAGALGFQGNLFDPLPLLEAKGILAAQACAESGD